MSVALSILPDELGGSPELTMVSLRSGSEDDRNRLRCVLDILSAGLFGLRFVLDLGRHEHYSLGLLGHRNRT